MSPADTSAAVRPRTLRLWRHPLLQDGVALALALASLAWFLSRGIAALDIGEFGDESEKIVGVRMIAAGERLYDTIFSNHGPAAFALNHVWLLLTGTKDLASHRIVQLGLFLLCAGAVTASPALSQWRTRFHAAALFLFPVGLVYAAAALHMSLYQGVAGALLTIALVLYGLPALVDRTPPRWAAIAAGFAAASAAFAAYPYAVAGALMVAAAVIGAPARARWRRVGDFLIGAFAAAAAMGAWMALYADIAGYAVYHFWYNQTVYAEDIRYSPLAPLRGLLEIDARPAALTHMLAQAAFFAAIVLLVLRRPRAGQGKRLAWGAALAVLILCVAFFNPRGGWGFHGATFLVGALGALAVVAAGTPPRRAQRFAAFALLAACAALLALVHERAVSTPHDVPLREIGRLRIAVKPKDDRTNRLVRELLRPDERFLAMVYAPAVYLWADRLPISGLFYYLPVQAKYAARPVPGYNIDLCRDVREKRPKIVFYLDRAGTGRYGFADYAPCVQAVLTADYVPLPWAPDYLIRRDITAARPDLLRNRE